MAHRNLVLFIFTLVSVESYSVSSRITSINNNNIFPRSITSTTSLDPSLTNSITIGAQIANEHCQKAFKWDRWNCPEATFAKRYKHAPTKEIAYAKAILSAGIVHTITKNCSRGQLEFCGCDSRIGGAFPMKIPGRSIDQAEFNRTELKQGDPIQWAWGGCSDDVAYGSHIAQTYLDDLENVQDPQSEIHLHNNRIGRDIVQETMVKRCVCHGVSGSCTLQTCWMQVAPFEAIAMKLKEKYKRAIQIDVESDNTPADNPVVEIPEDSGNDLIYLDESPNYCKADNSTGIKGTKGRMCSRSKLKTATVEEKRSCRNICRSCGFRVKKLKKIIKERCNCEFKWCCDVKCDTCSKTVEEFTCE